MADVKGWVYTLKITLVHSKPAIWRRIEVPGAILLGELHRLIQGVMGWDEAHLHQFIFGEGKRPGKEEFRRWEKKGGDNVDALWGQRRYADPLFELEYALDEWGVTLAEVAPEVKTKFTYEYDFGDGWGHQIVVEEIGEKQKGADYPRCTGGARRCPMEDSGSIFGWYDKLAIIQDAEHEEYELMREWMGLRPGDAFDAAEFDVGEANARMVKMAKDCDRKRKKWVRDNRA